MSRVLITAGAVYGLLDDNKIVSNRVRGLWASHFARWMAERGHMVTLLIPDTLPGATKDIVQGLSSQMQITQFRGYDDYAQKCYAFSTSHDAAIMAAAVVNWIPANPVRGKMPTEGYKEGDIIQVPFVLAPRVINMMRSMNPNLTLIGCKMLIDASEEALLQASQHVIHNAKCHAVIANDMGRGLKRKLLVYPDHTVQEYNDDFEGFFLELEQIIQDKYWRTEPLSPEWNDYTQDLLHAESWSEARHTFDAVVGRYNKRFYPRTSDTVFGSLLVSGPGGFLLSPRTKDAAFTSAQATVCQNIVMFNRTLLVAPCATGTTPKATMNAPLLIRMWQKYRPKAVLHLHEQISGAPTVAYAPPGTDRDNMRDIPSPVFNIEGHGFIACLNDDLEIPDV